MAKRKATNTRTIVLEILMELLPDNEVSNGEKDLAGQAGVFLPKENVLIRSVLDKYDYLETRDKALVKRLAEGCIEQKLKLDYVIRTYSGTPFRKIKPVILNILRMGIYQILYMDAIPDSAACNEAVNLAVDKGFRGLSGYVNGMLRTIAREKEHIPWPEKSDREEYLSVMYSMPEWLVHMWMEHYGDEITEKMLAAFQEPSGLMIRFQENLTKEQCSQWENEIRQQGCELNQHPYLPYAYTMKNVEGVTKLYGFFEGMFTVQDISSMLTVELAGIQKGDHVIDVCAAPGGKTMHAAQKTGNDGIIDAGDISEEKLAMIRENADRLQPVMLQEGKIRLHLWDARNIEETLIGKADVVLADLPCSGLGVIGHKGDIRYRVTRQQIEELAELQREILEVVYQYLKPGGILMYSTCTICVEENEKNRAWILEHLPMEAVPLDLPEGMNADCQTCREGYLQLLPGVHQSDGFFMAKFRRRME